MSKCIVCCGAQKWYPDGVQRLIDSLEAVGWDGATIMHKGVWPDGCPPHYEVPYAFKLHTIQEARDAGHEQVLWLDASAWAVKSPLAVLEKIQQQGHYFWWSGHWCDRWCNDKCLSYFGVTREQAHSIPMLYALVIGLDFRNPRSCLFFDRWKKSLDDGIFQGSWEDHRHDQSCASLIAAELGMDQDQTHDLCRLYESELPETVQLTFQGM